MEKYQEKQKEYENEENNVLNRLESEVRQREKHFEHKNKLLGG